MIYINQLVPQGFAATSQTLLAAAFFGLGGMRGVFLGGQMYAGIGPQPMFMIGGSIVLFGLLIFTVFSRKNGINYALKS